MPVQPVYSSGRIFPSAPTARSAAVYPATYLADVMYLPVGYCPAARPSTFPSRHDLGATNGCGPSVIMGPSPSPSATCYFHKPPSR
ncbi:hypothetical protein CCMA1212_002433 [Trichoderma ghanense]|uniref:Uncharacterized protein n=1 Tax=Trichoderma ghanense TaxID=65468 RepID=A0ABY2H9U8_9HYPO